MPQVGTWAVPVLGIWQHVAGDTHVGAAGPHFWDTRGGGGGERCRAGLGGSHLISSTCCHSWSVRLFHTRGAKCYLRVPLIHNSLMSRKPGLRFTGGRIPRQPLSGQYLFTSLPSSTESSGQTPFPSYVHVFLLFDDIF